MITLEEYKPYIESELGEYSKYLDESVFNFLENIKYKFYEIARKYVPEGRIDKRWRMVIDYTFSRMRTELDKILSEAAKPLTPEEIKAAIKESLPEQLSRAIAWARGMNSFLIELFEKDVEKSRNLARELMSLEREVREFKKVV